MNKIADIVHCVGILLITAFLVSCKKESAKPELADPVISPTTGSRMQFTLDSIYLYAKQIYLWNDILPGYTDFDPRSKYTGYDPAVQGYQKELFDISQLKLNPTTSSPFEKPVVAGSAKYSFLEDKVSSSGKVALSAGLTSGNPVLFCGKYTAGSTRVGYIALAYFPELTKAKMNIDSAFASLATENLSTVIVDLRTNGGGYVETAEYVANQLAPAAINGKIMYSEQFNSQMQASNAMILKYQPYLDNQGNTVMYKGRAATMADVDYSESGNTYIFNKTGGLQNIKNVYFIVGGATASASELLINCLRPYLQAKLVGSKTFGKPVGFIAINIDAYTIFMSNFLIKNANGNADYFDGMEADITAIPDNLHELGDPEETCLKATLRYIQTGKISASTHIQENSISTNKSATPLNLNIPIERGLEEHRFKLKNNNLK